MTLDDSTLRKIEKLFHRYEFFLREPLNHISNHSWYQCKWCAYWHMKHNEDPHNYLSDFGGTPTLDDAVTQRLGELAEFQKTGAHY